ncbi:unnamed protein product [Darwinula stevensoni]|uniref:Cation/H+ exchanger transmembrane domain-containing protein n=1 Tax=Darwinula stevensoni TaxID=69355 RepID=A0A7R9FSR1_9CRUS|nr:unnamed protein product [Darwinula stevensoni]CAG0904048.1 unnamed protein product [Darwinula stevensoni]
MANSHCHECVLRGDKEVNADATRWKRLRQSLLCPPGVKLGRACTFLLVFPLVWIAGYGLTGHEMLLDGNLFKIYIIFFACLLGGWLMEIIRLPGLLGMIIVGMIFGNLKHQISWMEHPIQHGWSGKIRGVALVVILIRAGLGLNPEQLRRLSLMVARLAFVPSTVEAIIVACVSNLILGLRWAWAFTLGFALAAVSPAIVVPYMLKIQENGYGVDKGIPTLLLAASSLNDVFSIWAFLVFLGITFSQRSFVMQTIMPFVEVLLGFLYGIVIGIILWFIPNRKDNFALAEIRSILLLIGGIASYFGSISIKMHSAGALGALTLAFVASYGWRRQGYKQDNPVSLNFNFLWFIFQPLLFGLVGAELDFLKIKLTTVRYGLIVIFIGLLFRCCGAFVVLSGGNLNVKEKLFVAFSWLPKATVQAAVGSNALDAALALTDPNPQHIEWGQDILTIAVMAILVSAPIGATFIRSVSTNSPVNASDTSIAIPE